MQAIAWESGDTDEGYMITIYGRTQDGKTVSVSTLFPPYFFVKLQQFETPESLAVQLKTQCKPVRAKTVWGFTNNELQTFVKCEFQTLSKMRECVWLCRRKNLKVFESSIDPLLRFMHRSGIQSVGWFEIQGDHERDFSTTCALKYFVKDWRSLKPIDRDDIAPFKIMSLDIECYSKDRTFPDAEKPDDTLFQIAMTTKTYGTNVIEQKCLSLGTATLKDTVCYATEKELLDAFTDYLHTVDPDVITGWNIFGFDMEYIYKRMVLCKCELATMCLGRRRDQMSEIKIKNLVSSALGSNVLKMLPMTGRYVFDLFQVIKAQHKLESYSLNNVSLEFLNDRKVDMPIHDMFKLYESHADLTQVAEYCLKDTELPIRIMSKLFTFENLVEMAKATWVPLSFLSERGQQIKVFSQIAKKARDLNFMMPTLFEKIAQPKYEGATVLEAQSGAYYKPITGLDFEGLYPSIMMAHNLCYSTLVMSPKYDNIPGVEYETYGEYKFAQNVQSLLPEVLSDLKKFRKKAKQDMKTASPEMYAIYNGKQLAYKISMNSVYGFTGAANGMLPCVAIASTVTCRGRQMIQESKEYVEKNFPGAKVRYGDTDSIMVEFDVGDRTGKDAIEYSWALGERASKEVTCLFKKPNNLELEKVYCPYFLYSKKRYAAKKWVFSQEKNECIFDEIDIKGLQVVRRDNCPFTRETCERLIDMILESSDPKPPLDFIEARKRDLLSGNVPMSQLILSKRLGDSYKSQNLAHVVVRNKIRERAPGSEPQSGDRVQFVVVEHPNKRAKMYEKAEDPKWVKEHPDILIDYQYYLKHNFENPVSDLLEPLLS